MEYQYKITVSVVVVCMNTLKNLYPCLDSIKKHTTVSYEMLVVAYLFSEKNLMQLKKDYPWITIIESNEIRGFSENNNLALRLAKGEYCFILNDDTFFDTPVIDNLVNTIEDLPENVAIISPNIKYPDGSEQCCGRPPITWWKYILSCFKLWNEKQDTKYINKKGLFQSYNIIGAAFLIKNELFRNMGYFDEQYFFCPEDIALSTYLNKKEYKCYVNSEIILYHIAGASNHSKISIVTKAVGIKGSLLFFSNDSILKKIIIATVIWGTSLLKYLYWQLKIKYKNNDYAQIQSKAYLNVLKTIFSEKTPKEIFTTLYTKL